jgi:hypothetical protein
MTGHHDHHGHGHRDQQSDETGPGQWGQRGRHRRVSPVEQVDRLVRATGFDLDEFDRLAAVADGIAEAVRALNHATLGRRAIPAPHVAPVLGSLSSAAFRLQQLLPQMNGCLAASLDSQTTGYRVTQDDGSDPLTALLDAEDHLTAAARIAGELARRLDAAQGALSRQTYTATHPADDQDREGLW